MMASRTHRRNLATALATGCLVALAAAAHAAPGVLVEGVDLRAGPGEEYPPVTPLGPGTPAEIYGCLPDYGWCDVAVGVPGGSLRGWAPGPGLQVYDDEQPVFVPQYGAALGIPLVGFDLGNYWGSYYRGQPWFHDEGRYAGDYRGPGPGFRDPGFRGPGFGGQGYRPPGGGYDPGGAVRGPGGFAAGGGYQGFHPGGPGGQGGFRGGGPGGGPGQPGGFHGGGPGQPGGFHGGGPGQPGGNSHPGGPPGGGQHGGPGDRGPGG